MKGRINDSGVLELQRGREWKPQECPRISEGFCGGWCPFLVEGDKYAVTLRCGHIEVKHEIMEDLRSA